MPYPFETIPQDALQAFCHRWQIVELSVYGSALREDFTADSDIDLVVAFAPNATWSLFDWSDMIAELEQLFQRRVDLSTKRALEKSLVSRRARHILESRQILVSYAA